MPVAQQRALAQAADPADGSVQARCQALGLARSSFYYQPRGESARNLELMRLLTRSSPTITLRGYSACATTCGWPATSSTRSACAASCARWATSRSTPNRA